MMIGRASIGNPWIFREIKHFVATGEILPPPQLSERVDAALEHLEMGLAWKGSHLGVVEMRRHYANYFRGIQNFKQHRIRLVTEDDPDRVKAILREIREEFSEYVFG